MDSILVFILRYAWLGVLIIVELVWTIFVVKDIIDTIIYIKDDTKYDKFHHFLFYLESYTKAFFIVNPMILFLISFVYWYSSLK